MKNDYYEEKMRIYEDLNDPRIIPGMFVVARIDGRNFSTLTWDTLKLKPYDQRLTAVMQGTLKHLMNMGFMTVMGYTQSDEMSILLSPIVQNTFNGKIRKINSIMAGEASAYFSMNMGVHAAFDCRTMQLPSLGLVHDYFNWRVNDAEKNCLSMRCWHMLRTKGGLTKEQAQKEMDGKDYQWKHDTLMRYGMNFDKIDDGMKRGYVTYWIQYQKMALNPLTNEDVEVTRNKVEMVTTPRGRTEYSMFITELINDHTLRFTAKKK